MTTLQQLPLWQQLPLVYGLAVLVAVGISYLARPMRAWERLGFVLVVGLFVALPISYFFDYTRGCYDPTTIEYEYDPEPCR